LQDKKNTQDFDHQSFKFLSLNNCITSREIDDEANSELNAMFEALDGMKIMNQSLFEAACSSVCFLSSSFFILLLLRMIVFLSMTSLI